MKTSLWIVIVLVSWIVGFLMGYSVSSYTGKRNIGEAQVKEQKAGSQPAEAAGGYGADSGGYAAERKSAPKAAPAIRPAEKTAGY